MADVTVEIKVVEWAGWKVDWKVGEWVDQRVAMSVAAKVGLSVVKMAVQLVEK